MAETRMNLTALQQRDPYITEIVAMASQVALYSFSSQANQWKRTSVEGVLFIYKRSASPVTGFMILNRLGLNNLVEPITKDLEFQHQDPFLLYRNAKSIYGIWFYDKDECRRLGDLLQRYLQEILDKQNPKKEGSPTLRRRGSKGDGMHEPAKGAGLAGPSQVDIMQMLSRAQHEYNTHSKVPSGNGRSQIEPKPMIDNPNASATKVNNIIRPMPLKIPDTDQPVSGPDESLNPTTPGTAPISLDALFRTASLQQQSGSKFPQPEIPPVTKPPTLGRLVPVAVPTDKPGDYAGVPDLPTPGEDGLLPPLLKHIMSTGSMVEDIERGPPGVSEHTPTAPSIRHSASEDTLPHFLGGVPDLTQPPPTLPAYRGPSPKAPNRGASPMSTTNKDSSPQVTSSHPKVSKPSFSLGSSGQSVVSSVPTSSSAMIISGNLISQFTSAGQCQGQPDPVPGDTTSRSSITVKVNGTMGTKVATRGNVDNLLSKASSAARKEPSPVGTKVGSLLTPADLVQSSSVASTSSGTSSSHLEKGDPNLAAAAASLSTELLTPMAFTTSMARKTPPVSQTSMDEKSRDSSDNLPIAALTKEQLQQSLLYLIKNDSNFISTLHEAYLKSIQELSGQKT